MRKHPRNRKLLAGFVMAAAVLVGAGSLSALTRIFRSAAPLALGLTTGDFQFVDSEQARSSEAQTTSYQDSFSRVAPAWLTNALPGYSSGRAQESWYLSLNRADDRELRLDESRGMPVMTTNPYHAFQESFAAPSFQSSRNAMSSTTLIAPSARTANGTGIISTAPKTAITSPSSVNGPAVWNATPVDGDWNNDANWSPASPNGAAALALFGSTNNATISLSALTSVADIIFGSTANAYTISTGIWRLTLLGAGVTNNSSAMQNFVAQGFPSIFTGSGTILFQNSTTAGNNNVTYTAQGGGGPGQVVFRNSSKAGTANFIATANPAAGGNGGLILFRDSSSADHAIVTANGSTVANPMGRGGLIEFLDNADAGAATLVTNGGIGNLADSTGGEIQFGGDSTGGTARVEVFGNGRLNLTFHNSTGAGPHVTIGSLEGDGYVVLGGRNLGIGSNNTSTTFSGSITGNESGGNAGSITKVGTGLLVLSGANNYTGATTIAGGELFLASSGSLLSTSQIQLGGTGANTPSAMFTFGSDSGGITLTNSMIVQASVSGTEGRRTLLGVASNGAANTYSGPITLNTDLTVQSAAAGSTAANGQGILKLSGGIDVLDNTFEMNSNLRGNNADTYSIQGIVRVTGLLNSSLATGGSVVKEGSGTLILENTGNTYTGTDASNLNSSGTRIRGGILAIFGDTSLGLAPTNATNNVFFQSSAYNTNADSILPTLRVDTEGIVLAPTRNINIAGNVTAQFDTNGNRFTIAGNINGAGNLTKIGPGTLALTGANTYAGTTTIDAGTLSAAATNALGSTSQVTVNSGGTLLLTNNGTIDRINNNAGIMLNGNGSATPSIDTAGRSEYTVGSVLPGMGALTLQSSSIIDLSNGASIIAFANSATQAANWNGTLSIYNWSGNVLTGNGTDQLYFGTNATGLAPTQLLQISFYSDSGSTFLGVGSWATDLDGEVVPLAPVPEPSTWIGAALALGAIAFARRRKLRRLMARA